MSFKSIVIKNSTWLMLRENVNLVIRTAGVFVLTRYIGPQHYGSFTAIVGILLFTSLLGEMGINVFIVKYKGDNLKPVCDVLFTFSLVFSILLTLLLLISVPLAGTLTSISDYALVGPVLFVTLPFTVVKLVPLGIIERNMAFSTISRIDMITQLIYQCIAIFLAIAGMNVWAPSIAFAIHNVVYFLVIARAANFKPALSFNRNIIQNLITFGFNFTLSSFAWSLRNLINPFIVAPFAGVETVGYIALAGKIVDSLNFLREATKRVAISALARIQDDKILFRKSIQKGISYQVIALGPILLILIAVSPFLIPLLLGEKWANVLPLIPFIAFNSLSNSFGTMLTSALHVLNFHHHVAISHLIQNCTIALLTKIFLPLMGINGYGIALILAFPAHIYLFYAARKKIGHITYTTNLIWFFSLALPLFSLNFHYSLLAFIIIPFLFANSREPVVELFLLLIPERILKWPLKISLSPPR